MRNDLSERLTRANPAPAGILEPDTALLERLLHEPRVRLAVPRRRRGRGRLLVVLAAALIVAGGTAAAVSTFVVEYFGANDREPTPAAIVAELRRINGAPDLPKVDAEDFVRLAAFEGAGGRITVYGAAARTGGGFCVASAVGERFDAEGCGSTDASPQRVPYAGLSGDSYGDVYALYGRLTGDTVMVEIRFEDGTVKPAAVRPPFWIYVLGGEQMSPGHRPAELLARDAAGALVSTQQLFPPDFTSRSSADANLPASDGSPAQNAMHGYLETLIRRGGGGLAIEVDIASAHELRRFETPAGAFVIYEAAAGTNGVCVAYDGPAAETAGAFHADGGCFRDAPTDATPTPFANAPPAIGRLAPGVYIVEGVTPPGAATISVRYQDGSSDAVQVVYHASFAAWIGPPHTSPGRRPEALIARASDGRILDRLSLDPPRFP